MSKWVNTGRAIERYYNPFLMDVKKKMPEASHRDLSREGTACLATPFDFVKMSV